MNKKQLRKLISKKVVDPNIEGPGWTSSKRFKTLLIMSVGVLTLLLIVGIFNKVGFLEVLESQKELVALKSNIHRLEVENEALIIEIDALKNNPRYMERIAREDLGLARPGEVTFVFPDS